MGWFFLGMIVGVLLVVAPLVAFLFGADIVAVFDRWRR